jgi:hypothetical protein
VRRLVLLLLILPSFVLAACGGDDDASAPKTSTTTSTTEVAVKPDVFAFCGAQQELLALVSTVDRSDPKALQAMAAGDEYQALTAKIVSTAPAEIHADVVLLSQPVEAFAESGDYDAFLEAAGQQDQLDAQKRIDLFQTANCAG